MNGKRPRILLAREGFGRNSSLEISVHNSYLPRAHESFQRRRRQIPSNNPGVSMASAIGPGLPKYIYYVVIFSAARCCHRGQRQKE